ncbi:MAG: hypothetical protein AAF636_06510 [Pseudomonadota bacterium]
MTKATADDPKGLIREAYRIENIGMEECRSIFLDWALSLPVNQETGAALRRLRAMHATGQPDHPMTTVIDQGLVGMQAPRRRGGWRSRQRN